MIDLEVYLHIDTKDKVYLHRNNLCNLQCRGGTESSFKSVQVLEVGII